MSNIYEKDEIEFRKMPKDQLVYYYNILIGAMKFSPRPDLEVDKMQQIKIIQNILGIGPGIEKNMKTLKDTIKKIEDFYGLKTRMESEGKGRKILALLSPTGKKLFTINISKWKASISSNNHWNWGGQMFDTDRPRGM